MITVTHSAVDQIKKMMTSRSNMPHGIKLGINTKGCSGLTYTLEYVDNVDANDEVFEFDNIKIFVDPKSSLFLHSFSYSYSIPLLYRKLAILNSE